MSWTKQLQWGGAILIGGSLVLLTCYAMFFSGNPETPSVKLAEQKDVPHDSEEPATNSQDAENAKEVVVPDDGKLLWASPTSGAPLPLNHLPAGTQVILHVRLQDLLQHEEAERILAALGPWGTTSLHELSRVTAAQPEEISSLTLALFPTLEGKVAFSLRLELQDAWTEELLAQRFPNGKSEQREGQTFIHDSGYTAFLPQRSEGEVLVCCPQEILSEIVESQGDDALFPRDMEQLLQATDADRMVTLVLPNKFLQMSGRKFLDRIMEPLLESAFDILREDAATVALSAHWNESFFLEFQSTVNLHERPFRFAKAVADQIETFPTSIQELLDSKDPHEHGRAVVQRLPQMLTQLGKYTRTAEVNGISVLRTYLPLPAGHNLLMAAELYLQDFSSDSSDSLATSSKPETLEERLQQVTSLAFPKETLQRALEMLSEDIAIPIQIAGGDLQLEGITKNQSLSLELRDRPAAEILVQILLQANPDRTATGPEDPKQKLVYVVRVAGDGQQEIIVTTRVATLKRGEQLPQVFGPAQ